MMNDLLSGRRITGNVKNDLEGGGGKRKEAGMSVAPDYNFEDEMNLRRFFEEVKEVKEEMGKVKEKLKEMRGQKGEAKEAGRRKVEDVQRSAGKIKGKVEDIERGNAANRRIPGCGAGSASDRTRTAITAGLRKSAAAAAAEVREVEEEYRAVAAAAAEMEEAAAAAAAEVADGLSKLQHIFMDMALFSVDPHPLVDLPSQLNSPPDVVDSAGEDLHSAIRLHHNTRKWSCILALLISVVILVIVIPILIKFVPSSSSSS